MVKVFIVEDKPSIQFFYEIILTLNSFEVSGVANQQILTLKYNSSYHFNWDNKIKITSFSFLALY